MEFQPQGILLTIGESQLQIRYYGLIIVFAMLVGATVAARLAKRVKYDPEHVWGALTWAIIPGIILARAWFVLFPSQSIIAAGRDTGWYLQHFFDTQNGAIAIWSGGLSIFGAVLGGFLGVYVYMRKNKLPLPAWLDIAAVALPLGQAIGRWANFINQELYGSVTTLPWGISIESAYRIAPYQSTIDYPVATTLFHPLFLYESLLSLLLFIVLLNLFTRQRSRFLPGDLMLFYIAGYSAIRFLLEFLRVDITTVGSGINVSQVVTGLGFIAAVGYFLYRHRAGAVTAAPPAAEPTTEPPSAA
ncbi:MAG TPA: prolipoprotein diacylglyceryl transferase [Phototrophicaceae bacterium]|nr:prolipoprotein diacylglyceryl transferase [Phototrophicaceae bacterium]